MKRARNASIAIVMGAAIGVVTAGCYWPVPSCRTISGPKEYKHSEYEMSAQAGGFRLHQTVYASCKELCAAEPGVLAVNDCKPPELIEAYPKGPKSWKVACDVEAEMCHLPEIIEPLQWH